MKKLLCYLLLALTAQADPQTPWTSDIDSAGFNLTNTSGILIGSGNGSGATFTDSYKAFGFGDSVFAPTTLNGSSYIFGVGYDALGGQSAMDNSSYVFAYGESSMTSAQVTNSQSLFAYGHNAMGGTAILESSEIYAYGSSVLDSSSVVNAQKVFAFGADALAGVTLDGVYSVYAFGDRAGRNSSLTNCDDFYAFGTGAGAGMVGEFDNVFLIGSGAVATGNNQWVAGDASYDYFFPGPSATFSGTIIHGTNTYSGSITDAPADPVTVVGYIPITNAGVRYYMPLYQ